MGRLALRGVEGGLRAPLLGPIPTSPRLTARAPLAAPHLEWSRTRNTDDTLALPAAPHKPVCGLLENTVYLHLPRLLPQPGRKEGLFIPISGLRNGGSGRQSGRIRMDPGSVCLQHLPPPGSPPMALQGRPHPYPAGQLQNNLRKKEISSRLS